jgi:hypothetical protein
VDLINSNKSGIGISFVFSSGPEGAGDLEEVYRETGTETALAAKRINAWMLMIGTGNTGWTNVWRYGDKTNYHMTNLGGTFRTLDNVDGRCELEQGILSQVRDLSSLIQIRTRWWHKVLVVLKGIGLGIFALI